MECDGPVPNPRRLRGTPPQTGVHRPPRREHAQHRSGRKLAGSHPAGKGGGIRRHRDRRAAFGRRGAGGHARQHAQPHLHADGTPLSEPVAVAGKTLRELRSDYILKAADPARRTRIPTLEEYLAECARNGLYTFIEPKLYDPTGRHYRDIVAAADAALGRDRYVVTSNNRANDVIRRTGIDDVRLMGILYQTTFERIEALGDVIVAVSATRFDEADYSRQVARVKAAGLMCESHADKFVHFDRINRHDIDFVSTDFLAPDYRGQGRLLAEYARADGFVLPASADEGAIRLGEGQSIVPKRQLPAVPFGALYLELEAEGSARIELGGQTFTLDVPDKRTVTHQVLLHDAAPALRITALAGGITLTAIRAKVVAFEQ